MKILVINSGSSSIKYQLLDMKDEKIIAKGIVERIGEKGSFLVHKVNGKETKIEKKFNTHAEGLEFALQLLTDKKIGVLKSLKEIYAVGHRILHGGGKYTEPTIITPKVIEDLKSYIPLGPLHMPANIQGIEACQKLMPKIKNVGVFDTAFHATMPPHAYLYAVPYEWYKKYGVRKYGFHGTSHEYIATELAKAINKDITSLRIISCHLGSGGSISAVYHGKCLDTSMGFTPLEGLVMGTRSGNVDPAVIEYVMDKTKIDIHEMLSVLNKKSGLLGISGVSPDLRDIISESFKGNKRCKIAIDKYVYMVKKYIGAYISAMGGVDAIAFSAGVGERSPYIRERVCKGLECFGIEIDKKKNRNFLRGVDFKISSDTSKVEIYIIPTNEELSIARKTKELVENKGR